MNSEQIKQGKQEILKQYGDWTAHTIHLKDNIYTYAQDHPHYSEHMSLNGMYLKRIIQVVSDLANQPLKNLRILDLACLEGMYGIEFARHGATVVGIEGREANIEKARFVKTVLSLDNIELEQDDVRHLSVEKYGQFDIVLCLGILYHLDVPDVFSFLERISEVCKRIAVIDTHVAINAKTSYSHSRQKYHGLSCPEHKPGSSKEDRLKLPWASLDNVKSFWFTRASLYNLLSDVGFTSVYTCHNPAIPKEWKDRDTLIAIKAERQKLFSLPDVNNAPEERWPEVDQVGFHPGQRMESKGKVRSYLRRILKRIRTKKQ